MIRRHLVGLMAPVLVIGILIFCGAGSRALAEELDIAGGTIYITEMGYQQGTVQNAYTGPYTITGTGSESIVVQSGTHDITILNLQIAASGKPAIRVEAGATLNLTVMGENRLTGGSGFAGICVAPAYDSQWNYDADASGKLYLSGDGTLNVKGGDGDAAMGTYGGGAGIGGNGEDQHGDDSVDFGLVCVTENFTGILDASGGAASFYVDGENAFGGGAGIGSGGFNMGLSDNYTKPGLYYWGEVVGRIELHGGTIRARSTGNGRVSAAVAVRARRLPLLRFPFSFPAAASPRKAERWARALAAEAFVTVGVFGFWTAPSLQRQDRIKTPWAGLASAAATTAPSGKSA